jgi:hypothetical protein
MDRLHLKWQVAWDKKVIKGFRSRFKMWGDYLSEYRDDAEGQADRYGYEVRLRVMLHLLQAGVKQQLMSEIGQLNTLDNSLRTWLMRGQFLRGPEYLPKETYWYLYGYLPGKLEKSRIVRADKNKQVLVMSSHRK